MNDAEKFQSWLSCFEFAIGYDRYGKYGANFVAMACDADYVNLSSLADDLSGGDNDALEAKEQIEINGVLIEKGADPAEAMKTLVDGLKKLWRGIEDAQNAIPIKYLSSDEIKEIWGGR